VTLINTLRTTHNDAHHMLTGFIKLMHYKQLQAGKFQRLP